MDLFLRDFQQSVWISDYFTFSHTIGHQSRLMLKKSEKKTIVKLYNKKLYNKKKHLLFKKKKKQEETFVTSSIFPVAANQKRGPWFFIRRQVGRNLGAMNDVTRHKTTDITMTILSQVRYSYIPMSCSSHTVIVTIEFSTCKGHIDAKSQGKWIDNVSFLPLL